jgi:alpha-methylacyl-CoA racemase
MDRPLSTLNVLDFTTLLPGPFATMMLADLGANVVRIEAPHRQDMMRMLPPFDGDTSAWHGLLNRSKRSLALDMKKDGAVSIVKRLVEKYDIVVEQFRPGVMDKLGIGYDALREVNPSLIYCSITGYGQSGPYKDRAGHDNNYLSLAGVMSHTGRKEGGPAALGVQIADVGGGSFGAIAGILAAVIQRQVTGEGQAVDISMFDMSLAWNSTAVSTYLVGGENPLYESTFLNGGTYYDYYRTRDGRYLSVGSLEPKFWQGFCNAIKRPHLIALGNDPTAQAAIKQEIREAITRKDLSQWIEIFGKVDVCVEPVLTVEESLQHPQTIARDMVADVPKAGNSTQQQIASPFKFSGSKAQYSHIGSALGQHTDEILSQAGYNHDQISDMRKQGLLGIV